MHMREANLYRLARDLMTTGELPTLRPGLTRDLKGSGRACALCGAPVLFEEVECQLSDDVRTREIRFHLSCHRVWVTASISYSGGSLRATRLFADRLAWVGRCDAN
jgi:hypothetical protein